MINCYHDQNLFVFKDIDTNDWNKSYEDLLNNVAKTILSNKFKNWLVIFKGNKSTSFFKYLEKLKIDISKIRKYTVKNNKTSTGFMVLSNIKRFTNICKVHKSVDAFEKEIVHLLTIEKKLNANE